ncbi:FlxA-like family protein [Bacillus sp. JJ1521]|uniref:FlxA-like family protein n=1 Tax=Bacillus sp. JJ1521 TaxID=3122957 RepID=UPI003000545E
MATFPFLLKVTGVTALTGAITLGLMTTWNGTDTVNNAITTIQQQAGDLGIYETNENKLVDKINELKTLRDELQGQVATLTSDSNTKQETIDSLNVQIEGLNSQIDSLEADVATANTNGETLAQRIDALEAELQEANDDITRLQAELDATTSTDAPLTETEMSAILETQQTPAQ